jgi:hypothetical protein
MEKEIKKEYEGTLHRFVVDFLDAPITVSIGKTFIDALGKVDHSLTEGENPRTKGMTISGEEEGYCIIILPEDADLNTIVHESVHCVNYLIHYFDLPKNPVEDEMMAYLTGYIVDCVFDAFEVHKKETEKEEKPQKKKKS